MYQEMGLQWIDASYRMIKPQMKCDLISLQRVKYIAKVCQTQTYLSLKLTKYLKISCQETIVYEQKNRQADSSIAPNCVKYQQFVDGKLLHRLIMCENKCPFSSHVLLMKDSEVMQEHKIILKFAHILSLSIGQWQCDLTVTFA